MDQTAPAIYSLVENILTLWWFLFSNRCTFSLLSRLHHTSCLPLSSFLTLCIHWLYSILLIFQIFILLDHSKSSFLWVYDAFVQMFTAVYLICKCWYNTLRSFYSNFSFQNRINGIRIGVSLVVLVLLIVKNAMILSGRTIMSEQTVIYGILEWHFKKRLFQAKCHTTFFPRRTAEICKFKNAVSFGKWHFKEWDWG